MITLEFKDKTSAECELHGSVEVDGKRYAVFRNTANGTLYIYTYKPKKKGKYKLFQVADEDEFRRVCVRLSELIKES